MDIVWDESNAQLELVLTNVKQAKKKLDEAIAGAKKKASGWPAGQGQASVPVTVVDEASRQLEVALDQLMEFLEPMDEDELDEEDCHPPAPKPKKAKAKAKPKKVK
jgi:hypothetical protein